MFLIITLFEQQIRNPSCLSDFQLKSNFEFEQFVHIYILASHMLDAYWFNYEMQTTITLLGGHITLYGLLVGNHITPCLVLAHSCITLPYPFLMA